MKKALYASVLTTALLAGAANAEGNCSNSPFAGWHAGAFIGLQNNSGKLDSKTTADAGLVTVAKSHRFGKTAGLAGVNGGWGTFLTDRNYLGFDLAVSYMNSKQSLDSPAAANIGALAITRAVETIENDWRFAFALKAGRLLADNVLFYGRLGLDLQSQKASVILRNDADARRLDSSKKFVTPFLTPGIGVNVLVADHYSVNAEVTYDVALSRKKLTHNHSNGTNKHEQTITGQNALRFTAGFSYRF